MEDNIIRDKIKNIEPLNGDVERDVDSSFAPQEIRDVVVENYPQPKERRDIKTKKSWFLGFLKLGFSVVAILIAIMVIIELAKINGLMR